MKLKDYLNESTSRHAHIYKAKNGKWYLELGDHEYAAEHQSTTYGPFNTEKDLERELQQHSNPGGFSYDDSGTDKVPKKSPNGRAVQKPTRQRRDVYSFSGLRGRRR